jgi:hypothetical protein
VSLILSDMILSNTTRLEKLGKKLLGENDVEAVLERLDRLTREEAQTTATQTLELVHGLVKNIKVVMEGARGVLASRPCCVNRCISI